MAFKNIYEAERTINKLIEKDNNCSAHFNYSYQPNTCVLDVVTYNPTHKNHFLLHSLEGTNRIDALNNMYEYIYNLKETLKKKDTCLLNYTITWYSHPAAKSFSSSFYGKNIETVIKKFFYGKSPETLVIHNIKLNPIS